MNVNATVFIQIINFWVTYVMLHKLLFKPFVRLIENKKVAKETLLGGLKEKELVVLNLQETKKSRLEEFRAYVRHQYAWRTPQLPPMPLLETSTTQQKDVELLSQKTTEFLVKNISKSV